MGEITAGETQASLVPRRATLILLAAFGGFVAVLAIGLTLDPREIPSPLIGKAVPRFELPAVRGRSLGLSSADLKGRTFIVAAFVIPLAFALGYCFPIGLRLVGRRAPQLTAWMWGVNGACGVMASILAVMVSMWLGIQVNLIIAAVLYLALTIPMRALRSGNSQLPTPSSQLPDLWA